VHHHNERDGEKGTTKLNVEEKKMVARTKKIWYDYLGRR
jgi:hypothetical protein